MKKDKKKSTVSFLDRFLIFEQKFYLLLDQSVLCVEKIQNLIVMFVRMFVIVSIGIQLVILIWEGNYWPFLSVLLTPMVKKIFNLIS